jgi:hypothetical protein
VEIFLVLMENGLYQIEDLTNVCQFKFILMDQFNDGSYLRFENFIDMDLISQ